MICPSYNFFCKILFSAVFHNNVAHIAAAAALAQNENDGQKLARRFQQFANADSGSQPVMPGMPWVAFAAQAASKPALTF